MSAEGQLSGAEFLDSLPRAPSVLDHVKDYDFIHKPRMWSVEPDPDYPDRYILKDWV